MSEDKKDFFGKEVTVAIKNACDSLGVPQEKLEIEVLETGSTGIFGLIRKKAHIRVSLKTESEDLTEEVFEVESFLESKKEKEPPVRPEPTDDGADTDRERADEEKPAVSKESVETPTDQGDKVKEQGDKVKEESVASEKEPVTEVSAESLEVVKAELLKIVELMGFPSTLEVDTEGLSVSCILRGEFEENLIGPDGKVLDSLQYILRKVVSRKVPERLRISINVGEFRERRLEELKVKAVELAGQVKEDGKTQVLPALNPSERRVIHMILQEDKEIRSRSVGEGLFKKILIYKPGKGNRSGGRRRSQSKGRQKKSGSQNGNQG